MRLWGCLDRLAVKICDLFYINSSENWGFSMANFAWKWVSRMVFLIKKVNFETVCHCFRETLHTVSLFYPQNLDIVHLVAGILSTCHVPLMQFHLS